MATIAKRKRKEQDGGGAASILRSSESLCLVKLPPGISSNQEEIDAAQICFDGSDGRTHFVLESQLPLHEENMRMRGRVESLREKAVYVRDSGSSKDGQALHLDVNDEKSREKYTFVNLCDSHTTFFFSRRSARDSDALAATTTPDDEGEEDEKVRTKKKKRMKEESKSRRRSGAQSGDSDDDNVGASAEKKKKKKKK